MGAEWSSTRKTVSPLDRVYCSRATGGMGFSRVPETPCTAMPRTITRVKTVRMLISFTGHDRSHVHCKYVSRAGRLRPRSGASAAHAFAGGNRDCGCNARDRLPGTQGNPNRAHGGPAWGAGLCFGPSSEKSRLRFGVDTGETRTSSARPTSGSALPGSLTPPRCQPGSAAPEPWSCRRRRARRGQRPRGRPPHPKRAGPWARFGLP